MAKSRRPVAQAVAALALSVAVSATAQAQVRTEPAPSSLVNPDASNQTRALFARSGLFMVSGGVLPGGHATFLLEQNGGTDNVPASAVSLAMRDGAVVLRSAGAAYAVGMPRGLACPLGQFVARDGIVAYTVPKYIDPAARGMMMRAGIVRHRIAREFDGTGFEPLLRAADFGSATPLAPALAQQITASINRADGVGALVINASDDPSELVGSFVNSGMQVTYRVYLMQQTMRAEIGGVPLRYYWKMEQDGSAGLFAVDMYSQNWPAGSQLTDLAAPGAKPTQYDVVNFYQVAGLFTQLHQSNEKAFADFVDQACGKAI